MHAQMVFSTALIKQGKMVHVHKIRFGCAVFAIKISTFQLFRHRTGRGRDVSIPSSRVNDNICDCCDGSDEWLTRNRSSVKCPNTCKIF